MQHLYLKPPAIPKTSYTVPQRITKIKDFDIFYRVADIYENCNVVIKDQEKEAKEEELSMVEEIGPVMAKSIKEFFENEQTLDLLERLKIAGVNMKEDEEESTDDRFSGKIFVLTGSLEKYGYGIPGIFNFVYGSGYGICFCRSDYSRDANFYGKSYGCLRV